MNYSFKDMFFYFIKSKDYVVTANCNFKTNFTIHLSHLILTRVDCWHFQFDAGIWE